MVFDFLPVVGRVPDQDGVWIAGGYSGHGNVLGFACGRLVARAILGEPTRSSSSSSRRLRYWCIRARSAAGRARRPSAYAAFAIARSWIARPVESKSVTSPALRRPSASPMSTGPSSCDRLPRHCSRLDRCGELATVARLLPVVAEDVRAAISSTATSAFPGPSAPSVKRAGRLERASSGRGSRRRESP
jgi:hypothetical protein